MVTDPYVPPEQGPQFVLGSCGCLSYGQGPPSNDTGSNNDVYVDEITEFIYQKQGDVWVIIGSTGGGGGGGVQVYKGHYSGVQPTLPATLDPGIVAAFNYDLDPPFQTWKWSGTDWSA